jgi:hypothetical protein
MAGRGCDPGGSERGGLTVREREELLGQLAELAERVRWWAGDAERRISVLVQVVERGSVPGGSGGRRGAGRPGPGSRGGPGSGG